MTNLGDVSHYLRIKVCRDQEKAILMLLQTAYLKVVLEHFRMSDYNLSSTPQDSGLLNTIMPSLEDYRALLEIIYWYRSAVGSQMYVVTITQPDIVFILT